MKKTFPIIILWLSNSGCNSYENLDRYEVSINEKVEIYYTANSSGFYCVSNARLLKHVRLVESKMVDSEPSDCDGCDYKAAFVFEGTAIGIDTVELKQLGGMMDCDSNKVRPELFVIEVKYKLKAQDSP